MKHSTEGELARLVASSTKNAEYDLFRLLSWRYTLLTDLGIPLLSDNIYREVGDPLRFPYSSPFSEQPYPTSPFPLTSSHLSTFLSHFQLLFTSISSTVFIICPLLFLHISIAMMEANAATESQPATQPQNANVSSSNDRLHMRVKHMFKKIQRVQKNCSIVHLGFK